MGVLVLLAACAPLHEGMLAPAGEPVATTQAITSRRHDGRTTKAAFRVREEDLLAALDAEQVYVDMLTALGVGGGTPFLAGLPASSLLDAVSPMLGIPYVWGGATPMGLDCSGFTLFVFRRFGLSLPHSSVAQALMGLPVEKGALQPGDLVFFSVSGQGVIDHVGLIVGPDLMAHCSGKRGRVAIESFSRAYPERFVAARRLTFPKVSQN